MKATDGPKVYRTKEMSKRTGVPASKLYYYEDEGLLIPKRTENGYRLYTDADVERLRKILLLRKYDVEVKDIRKMLDDPEFDLQAEIRRRVEAQQLRAREEAEELEGFSRAIAITGCLPDSTLLSSENLTEEVDYMEKHWNLGNAVAAEADTLRPLPQFFDSLNELLAKFARIREHSPESEEAQELSEQFCRNVRDFFSGKLAKQKVARFFSQIFSANGYVSRDVDSRNGAGTAKMIGDSLRIYARKKEGKEL